ncbi:hypothetical protein N2152v2_005985 [Parachlorella kessleri]
MAALTSAPVLRAFAAQNRLPTRASRAQKVAVRAVADQSAVKDAVVKACTVATMAGSLLAAGNAQAAMEVANLAANDNRAGIIASLALPALGWVGFNILGPLQNQLAAMDDKKQAALVGLGLGAASLLAAGQADAATEAMQLAANDNRAGIIASLALPALGWVGFNILGPLQNQLAAMDDKKRAALVGLGLGAASLLAAGQADAATEAMQLAAGDSRGSIIASLAIPVLGWVGFNILGPLKNQLDAMDNKRSVAVGLGLGAAALLAAGQADAATEAMQLAAGDNRFGVIALLFVPVLGWVAFNIAQPFFNQLSAMDEQKQGGSGKRKRSVAVGLGLGLGAAALLGAGQADAATEAMQLAAGDGRGSVIALLFVPALGWVAYNIGQPFLNQLPIQLHLSYRSVGHHRKHEAGERARATQAWCAGKPEAHSDTSGRIGDCSLAAVANGSKCDTRVAVFCSLDEAVEVVESLAAPPRTEGLLALWVAAAGMEAQYLPRSAEVGDRVEVCWEEEDGAWFAGVVGAHKPHTCFPYRLDYDDGDEEWVLFTSSSALNAVWSEDSKPETSRQRQYRVLEGALSNGSLNSLTVPPVAGPEQVAAKHKRGRPPGSGKKPARAGGAAGTPYPGTIGSGGAAAAGQQPEHQSQAGSPSKRARTRHPAAAASGAKAAMPNLLNQLTGAAPSVEQGKLGSPAPSAVPSGAGAAALANGASPLNVSNRGQGGAAALAGSSPLAAAPPLRTPGGTGLRDPRRGPGSTSAVAATGAKSVDADMQQEQQQQQVAQPASLAPAAVTVIGFQFSAELASVSAVPEESPAGLRSGGSSRGTTPRPPRRSSSHGSDLHKSAGASAPAVGRTAQQAWQDADPSSTAAGAAAGPAAAVGLPSEEEIEREVACRNFERMLPNLQRTKEAIGRATGLALQAAKCNAAPGLMRLVLARMAAEDSTQQRTSVREREGRTDCGPQSAAGQAYPRVVGAALSQLIEAVARDGQATEKLEKVLLIWQRKAIISEKLLEPAMLLARTKSAQHASAWGGDDLAAALAGSETAAAGVPGLPGAMGGGASLQGQRAAAAVGAGEAGTAGAPARLSGEAALWRTLRRLPVNAVLLMKFINEKNGAVVQVTQKPQVGNQWVDMESLQAQAEARGVLLASPSRADQPAYGPSHASSWDEEDSTLGGSSPPNASPWHWELLQEAKRNAAFAAAQQQHVQAKAAAAAAAAQAAHWAELAASSKAQRAQQQQGGAGEPDEFEQEMLQQMAGSMLAAPQQGGAWSQQPQQDPWSQLATMEADAAAEGLYSAPPWSLPGSAAASAAGLVGAAASAAAAVKPGEGPPPLPFEPPPAAGGDAPPLPLDDDFDDGPPPLPAYSPPPDEYAPAEFGGLPPLPSEPPPEGDAGLDPLGTSPDFAPPLPSHSAPNGGASEPPLLPPGIAVAGRRQAAAPLPAASSRASLQPTLDTSVAAVPATPGGSLPQPATQHRTLRTWVGFVTELLPGGRGAVDSHGPDAGFFLPSAFQGGTLQVGARVRCEGEEWSGGQYRWRIMSLCLDTGALEDEDWGEDGFGEEALPQQPAAEFSQMPPGFQRTPAGQRPQQQRQQQVPLMLGQPRVQHAAHGARPWHASGLLGEMAAAGGLLEGPPPGFAAHRGPTAQQQATPPVWQAGGMPHAPGLAAHQHPYMSHMPEHGMQQQQQLQQQQGAGLWSVQQQQQYMGGMGWG